MQNNEEYKLQKTFLQIDIVMFVICAVAVAIAPSRVSLSSAVAVAFWTFFALKSFLMMRKHKAQA